MSWSSATVAASCSIEPVGNTDPAARSGSVIRAFSEFDAELEGDIAAGRHMSALAETVPRISRLTTKS
jgi:hypothetical protein